MPLDELLKEHTDSILNRALAAGLRAGIAHYPVGSSDLLRARLARFLELTREAIATHNLGLVLAYSRQLAKERFEAGYDLGEVQAAINVLEESIWDHLLRLVPPNELGQALGLCSTVLGQAKDVLARTYVSLASGEHVQSLNLESLFTGIEAGSIVEA